MITNKGKSVLAKYLIGQAPSYASHIAFGCGPEAIASGTDLTSFQDEFAAKNVLDFEMFRAPIISRGYVTENVLNSNGDILVDANGDPLTVSQIVFTAELPTDERYEITEMGVFSAGANPSAGALDSKILNTFSESENWEYHYKDGALYPAKKIDVISGQLDTTIPGTIDSVQRINDVETTLKVFRTNATNALFEDTRRVNRNERSRFLNSMLIMRGDASNITGSTAEELEIDPNDNSHIHLNGLNFNIDKNAGTDQIKLALSVINKTASDENTPQQVRIIVEFASAESDFGVSQEYARLKKVITGEISSTNRYIVISSLLEDLEKSSGFSWSAVQIMKIYVSIGGNDGISLSDQYYVALDAIRLDNISIANPLYGLTAYTVIRNNDSRPILKNPNSTTLAEFRFGIDVLNATIGDTNDT